MSQDSTNKIINQLQVRIKQLEKYTSELEKEHIEAELDYENYIGGVENWSVRRA